MFEKEPPGAMWIAFVVIVLVLGAMTALMIPPRDVKSWIALVLLPLVAVFFAFIAFTAFRDRKNSQKFFGDRVEFYRAGELHEVLPYMNVATVAYGFREKNEQFLNFSGPDRKPFVSLHLVGDSSNAGPTELNDEKLTRLRDLLNKVVARQIIQGSVQPEGSPWMREVRIVRKGLLIAGEVVPWSQISIDANESNGIVQVTARGRLVGKTSMIEDNIVPGLIAIEKLQAKQQQPA